MATPSKAQYLADILALLQKRYKLPPAAAKLPVLDAVIYGIGHEGATREAATAALESLRSGFFDWNEVRVSAIAELQSVYQKAGVPDAETKANRLRRFLRQLFEKTYGFSLEPLVKKPLKDSIKLLQEFEAMGSDFVLASTIRLALGGHALGVDAPTRRALTRLGVAEPETDDPTLRGALERAVPKTRGTEFADLIEALSHDTCVEGEPDCPRCELRKICPSSRTRKADPNARLAPPKPAPAKAQAAPVSSPSPPAPAPAKETPKATPPPVTKAPVPASPALTKPAPVPSHTPAKTSKGQAAPPAPPAPPAKAARDKPARPKS